MAHARETIRDAFLLACTGLTTTGTRVYASRVMPFADDNLPGLLITAGNEEVVQQEEGTDRTQFRNLEITVRGYDKLKTGLDDSLDDIAAEVETAVFAASINNIFGFDLLSTEIEILDGAEQDIGEITLTFLVQYATSEGVPGTAL